MKTQIDLAGPDGGKGLAAGRDGDKTFVAFKETADGGGWEIRVLLDRQQMKALRNAIDFYLNDPNSQ